MRTLSSLGSFRRVGVLARLCALVVVVTCLAGCRREYEWHQKLTLTVETPAGERSGSSVVGVHVWYGRLPLSASEREDRASGEATVVEVAPGKYLFALLGDSRGMSSAQLALLTFWDDLPHSASSEENWRALSKLRATRPVPRKRYSLLAAFTDIHNPRSGKLVEHDNLTAIFGPGVSLKSITLEITDEPVTKGRILQLMPWLADPAVMAYPGFQSVPIESREAIGGLLTSYPNVENKD